MSFLPFLSFTYMHTMAMVIQIELRIKINRIELELKLDVLLVTTVKVSGTFRKKALLNKLSF